MFSGLRPEKRQYVRLPVDISVEYVRDKEVRRFFTKDLSAGGFLFKADEDFEMGQTYTITFDLPTEDSDGRIVAEIEIRRVESLEGSWKKVYGALFKRIGNEDRQRIHRYIQRMEQLAKAK